MKPCYLLVLCALTPTLHADIIRVRADHWFPVNGQPDAPAPGFGIEIANRIWRAAGHQLDYRLMSWGRALEAVRQGEADCVIGAYVEDAPDFLFPQEPLGSDRVYAYVRKGDNWRFTGVASLDQRSVAVINDYSYGKRLDAWLADPAHAAGIQFAYGESALEGNIRKLLAGRVDVLFESPMVMDSALSRLGLAQQVEVAGEGAPLTDFYMACTSADPRAAGWLTILDQGIRKMRADGELARILARYGLN